MKRNIFFIVLTLLFVSCQKEEVNQNTGAIDVSLLLPRSVDVYSDEMILTLNVVDGKAPQITDKVLFQSTSGVFVIANFKDVSKESVDILLPGDFESGAYKLFIRRNGVKTQLSPNLVNINIIEHLDFEPSPSSTIYGRVMCGDKPVKDAVISDGYDVVTTDDAGYYQMTSKKIRGYVFISLPSGYDATSKGVLPEIWKLTKSDPTVCEQINFELVQAADQSNYTMLIFGDMHLAKRTNDLNQFAAFTKDVNLYLDSHKGQTVYALTLGDMTWDLYWYTNNFSFPEYLDVVNSSFKDKNLQIFHTMGNHDNDYMTFSDLDAERQYISHIAPNYYSFNIGNIHYVVLDDINCSRYDGTDSRNYFVDFTSDQLNWLSKDLKYVSKDTPIVLTTHAPIYYPNSWNTSYHENGVNPKALFDVLKGYNVHFVTGHTHKIFNVTPQLTKQVSGVDNMYEHNAGAVCASWWWSGNLTPGMHLCQDGTHGGYTIWDVHGKEFKWLYKSTGFTEDHQFHAYDLNNVSFSLADVPNMPSSLRNKFKKYTDAYPANKNNEVLINIWNWNPDWKVTVTDEYGKDLPLTRGSYYDPQHIAALTVKRFNKSGITSEPSFTTDKANHFFKVKAADENVDLNITVEDEFGHVWKKKMVRPQKFSADYCY